MAKKSGINTMSNLEKNQISSELNTKVAAALRAAARLHVHARHVQEGTDIYLVFDFFSDL